MADKILHAQKRIFLSDRIFAEHNLLSQRQVLESQLRTQPEGGLNQTEQSQNRQHHGQRVSDSMVRKVNPE